MFRGRDELLHEVPEWLLQTAVHHLLLARRRVHGMELGGDPPVENVGNVGVTKMDAVDACTRLLQLLRILCASNGGTGHRYSSVFGNSKPLNTCMPVCLCVCVSMV